MEESEELNGDDKAGSGEGDDELLGVADVARMLIYSDRWVRQKLNSEEMKGYRGGERGQWRVPTSEVMRYMGVGDREQQALVPLASPEEILKHDRALFAKCEAVMTEAELKGVLLWLDREDRHEVDLMRNVVRFTYFSKETGNGYQHTELYRLQRKLVRSLIELWVFVNLNFDEVKVGRPLKAVRFQLRGDLSDVEGAREHERRLEGLRRLTEECRKAYDGYRRGVKRVLAL